MKRALQACAALRGLSALLHIGAGLALAAWGRQQWPLVCGGMLPLAIALMLAGLMQRPAQRLAVDGTALLHATAAAAMLPMMVGLPTMQDLCSGAALGLAGMGVLHLLAMAVAPALIVWRRPPVLASMTVCSTLLVGGGAMLLLWPGVQGLMLASLLHAAAWSIATFCGSPTLRSRPPARHAIWLPAVLVLLLGQMLSDLGPGALWLAHGALAVSAGVAVFAWLLPRERAADPARHPPRTSDLSLPAPWIPESHR